MKKRKIVGICSSVGNKAKATNNTYPIIFINRIFIEISHSYNLIPIILSPTVDISEIEQMANMIDFLILTGGEDIHPQFYNEVINYDYYEYNACNPTLERDYFEIQLYSISKSLGKSILGICRGMQIINISEGGTLCQNIDTYLEHSIRKDGWIPYHSIKIKKNTILHQLLDIEEYTVSSTHHQCIKKLGMNIVASAYSADGIVEAIELCSDKQKIIGFQGHIENIVPNNLIFVYQLLLEEKNGNLIFRYTTFNKKDIPQIHRRDFKAKINEYFGTNISVNFIFEQSIRPEISGKFAIIKTI